MTVRSHQGAERVAHHADNLGARLERAHSVRAEESASPGDQPSRDALILDPSRISELLGDNR